MTTETNANLLDTPERAPAAPARTLTKPSFIANVVTIAGRELRSYFDSLTAYVVIGITLLAVGGFMFMGDDESFWKTDRATMVRMFEMLPWMIAGIVAPGVTMRSVAEEKRSGTLELLITLPVRDSEVILGKYIGAMSLVLVLLAGSLLYPVAMFTKPFWNLGVLDWNPVWSGYLGLVLLSLAAVSVGLFFSSITENQIVAFFLSSFTLLALTAIGKAVGSVQGWGGDVLAFVSILTRFQPFAKGLIDIRAVVYFLSIAAIFLAASFRSLESRKWS